MTTVILLLDVITKKNIDTKRCVFVCMENGGVLQTFKVLLVAVKTFKILLILCLVPKAGGECTP